MKVKLAHFRERSTTGGFIDIAVFNFKPANNQLGAALTQLTLKARSVGLKVDKAALAFPQGNTYQFYGPDDLVKLLSRSGVPRWTTEISFIP